MMGCERACSLSLSLSECSKEKLCEHTVRWQPPTSQRDLQMKETYIVSTLILDFPTCRCMRNTILSFKPLSLWYFAMEAQAKTLINYLAYATTVLSKHQGNKDEQVGNSLCSPKSWRLGANYDGHEIGELITVKIGQGRLPEKGDI